MAASCDAKSGAFLCRQGEVVLRYCNPSGDTTMDNPNGSTNAIAGIMNGAGNVAGLMPHPERASEDILGSADGRVLLESFAMSLDRNVTASP